MYDCISQPFFERQVKTSSLRDSVFHLLSQKAVKCSHTFKTLQIRMLLHKSQQLGLIKAYETLWSSRSMQVDHFLRLFDCVLNTLSSFESDNDADNRLSACSLLTAINNKKFLCLLVFFQLLISGHRCVHKGLTKKNS